MATTTAPVTAASKALNCQTWVLKVSIHCLGCKRKVEKVLRGVDGVYATAIDSLQQRVAVTGNIEVEALIKELKKKGIHAEIWHDKLSSGKKERSRASNRNDQDDSKSVQKQDDDGSKESVKFSGDGSNEEKENTVDSTTSKNEGGGKKKNKKRQKGNANTNHSSGSATFDQAAAAGYGGRMNQAVSSTNPNPTRQHSVPYPQGFCTVPSGCGTNTSMKYPNGSSATNFYLAPAASSLYENTSAHRAITPTSLDSLDFFSDENVNGCMIM